MEKLLPFGYNFKYNISEGLTTGNALSELTIAATDMCKMVAAKYYRDYFDEDIKYREIIHNYDNLPSTDSSMYLAVYLERKFYKGTEFDSQLTIIGYCNVDKKTGDVNLRIYGYPSTNESIKELKFKYYPYSFKLDESKDIDFSTIITDL